jgi:hypothetical protein
LYHPDVHINVSDLIHQDHHRDGVRRSSSTTQSPAMPSPHKLPCCLLLIAVYGVGACQPENIHLSAGTMHANLPLFFTSPDDDDATYMFFYSI